MQSDYINPNDEEKEEKLDEDGQTPYSPPDDVNQRVPVDYPSKDEPVDSAEWYDEGDEGTEFPDKPTPDKPPKGFTEL